MSEERRKELLAHYAQNPLISRGFHLQISIHIVGEPSKVDGSLLVDVFEIIRH